MKDDFLDYCDEQPDIPASEGEEEEGFFGSEFDDYEADDELEDGVDVKGETAILFKNGLVATLTLKTVEIEADEISTGFIVRVDPREKLPTIQNYKSAEEARDLFEKSLEKTAENEWIIVKRGEPNYG